MTREPASVAEVSKEEAAVLVLRGKRLAALSMRALADQCFSRAQQQNTAKLQHATQESLVSCIQAFTGAGPTAAILPFFLSAGMASIFTY